MREFGDFQTPPELVSAVLDRLGPIGGRWTRVLEPTCGRGNFLAGLLAGDPLPREILGIEIQAEHLAAASMLVRDSAESARVRLVHGSLFEKDLVRRPNWHGSGPLLVVGNPPWVTNAEMGAIGGRNMPIKRNLKAVRGIDAKTGASNFDVAEAVWLELLEELASEEPTIALLCKTSVARNVLEHAARRRMAVADAFLARIDARTWFGASVEACLLCITLRAGASGFDRVPVFERLEAKEPASVMCFVGGRLVPDLDTHSRFAFADGACPFTWRQGLKHDAAGVVELTVDAAGASRNKDGQEVDIEDDWVYPHFKGGDLSRANALSTRRSVIVTQRHTGDDTRGLETAAPRLWRYLQTHDASFGRRKSSIYRGRPPYAMFGVGPYTFAPFKVAVSGLHKRPIFHAIGPVERRPVLFDDTCYFVPAHTPEQCALMAALLNGSDALGLLNSLAFEGAKRPVTKQVLQRLDLEALLAHADRPNLLDQASDTFRRLTGSEPRWPHRLERLLRPEQEV